jgi:glycerol-3-phosphate dehydrogenase (NAD(P)+)
MITKPKNIFVIGAGMIGTAIGNILAAKNDLSVTLFTIESDVADSINTIKVNKKYFPNIKLSSELKAITELNAIKGSDIIFLAIPSGVTVDFILKNSSLIPEGSVIVNLAKGFGKGRKTITEYLAENIPNTICSLKGPTFAREIVSGSPTAFTFAANDQGLFPVFSELFNKTNIFLDFTTDVKGIEILSILKNIYAIVLGIVDAHFDSPNLRFLILTKAFDEMKRIHLLLGGKENTIFNYCGYGDFSLTALNDLSRNRTLGLLIGKGFFIENISDKVVLEGKIAVNIFIEQLSGINHADRKFPILYELYKVFNNNYNTSNFVNHILKLIDSRTKANNIHSSKQ